MSNAAVGPVYDTIISEVINAVRVDFEENGVDDSALEDLKKTWQHKLSQMKVAQFPWDPKPEPQATPAPANGPPATAPPPTATPAAASYTQSTLTPQAPAQTLSLPGAPLPGTTPMPMKPDPGFAQADPAIKQEPGLPGVAMHRGYNPANGAPSTAAQRAALALESQFGQRAAASINALHSGMAPQVNPAQPQQGQRPGQVPQHINLPQQPQMGQQQQMGQHPQMNQHQQLNQQQQPLNPQQQYRQGVAAQIQQRMQQVPRAGPPNGLPTSQLDGSSDAVEAQRGTGSGPPAAMDRAQVDELLHAQIAARAREMEGGGLMLPLKEATKDCGVAEKRQKTGGPAQFDGPDDDVKDEEDDEDAINSDLDDPDEAENDDEDDEDSMGQMMLCMYDKVQRVKNKWKCILKDGVLTVNGKEYVFHKATGEYEW